jgi:hypothetical protein
MNHKETKTQSFEKEIFFLALLCLGGESQK